MIKLGQMVRDTMSGFQGRATARTEWVHGCVRVMVQPPVDKDGKLPDAQQFDEPGLEVVEDTPTANRSPNTGGPATRPSQAAAPAR